MAWYLDEARIFVQEKSSDYKQIIARLQPLAGETVHHIFGYESPIFKISALVVGETDAALIAAMPTDGELHSFSGPVGSGWMYVNSVTLKDQKAAFQTIRPDLDCSATVYVVDVELYLD